METPRPIAKDAPPAGREKRAHVRYPVSLAVDVMIEGAGSFPATARDFGLGGFLLAFNQGPLPAAETPLENKLCLLTVKIDLEQYRLRARIVRADNENIGVAFIKPDQVAIQALQHHATNHSQSVITSDSDTQNRQSQVTVAKADNIPKDKFHKILQGCNDKTRAVIEPLITQFLSDANTLLLELSKNEADISIQNAYLRALQTINSNRTLCISTYTNAIDSSLSNNHVLEIINDTKDSDEKSSESLELVSDEDFDIWLATSKAINKIEAEFAQQIGAIEQRLSKLYNQQVDRRNNPFGPSLFVNNFQEILEMLELDSNVMTVCYDIFKNILLKTCQQLYIDINQILIASNILPRDKDVIAYARRNNPSLTNNNSVKADKTEEQPETETNEPDEGKNGPENEIATNSVREGELIPAPVVAQQNLYELVGEIRNLQQQLRDAGQQPGIHPGTTTVPALYDGNTANTPAYSTAEVLDLIASVGNLANTARGDGQTISQFREKLQQQLADRTKQGDDKTLGQQQVRVIDVTENIFTAILNDLQVAQSVRPWLERLAMPVMKIALLDDSIFTDKEHVVRKVINKLAELEVLASAQDQEEQAAVRQAFTWVLNLVEKEFDGTTKVYNRANQQLELLINVQKKSFDRNIKQVIAEAIQEESDREYSADTTVDSDNPWLRMARRLKENHWVLFDANKDDAKRLKVAWIAPRKGKYIFVNVMGRKDRITTDKSLADEFKNGSAVVLDGGDDPAMDRAQYSMLQKLHKQLIYQSSHDELTGLINRREFLNCIQHAVEDAKQSKNKHAICYIDIDDFKIFNTNYGYEAGDKLLQDLITLIKNNIEQDNVLARTGADQFALLLQKTSMDDALEYMEDIMEQLEEYRFEWDDNRMTVTTSTGITIVNSNSDTAENVLQSAESSCSLAKESGGNQIQIASAGSNRLSRRKKDMEWATKIDKALDENGLYLRCQKIMPIQPHLEQLPHYEILLGISDELGGNASLADFIQAAEQHNRMAAVDRWVIKTAFQWLANNEDMVSDISGFTINLSGQSLNNEQLIEFIYDKVNKTSVPIEKICFEVTETAGVSSLSDTSDFIETIKGTGCKFALDDFGTGMSSYSYLKSLPVDYLKIDGVFIKDIVNNKNDYAVVKSVCEIGHFMDKLVIAEFVQDQRSAELLQAIGVDYLQGFGIAKPHRLDELLR